MRGEGASLFNFVWNEKLVFLPSIWDQTRPNRPFSRKVFNKKHIDLQKNWLLFHMFHREFNVKFKKSELFISAARSLKMVRKCSSGLPEPKKITSKDFFGWPSFANGHFCMEQLLKKYSQFFRKSTCFIMFCSKLFEKTVWSGVFGLKLKVTKLASYFRQNLRVMPPPPASRNNIFMHFFAKIG